MATEQQLIRFVSNTYANYTQNKSKYDNDGSIYFCSDKPIIITKGKEYIGLSEETLGDVLGDVLTGVADVSFDATTNTFTISYSDSTPNKTFTLTTATSSKDGLMSKEDKEALDDIKSAVGENPENKFAELAVESKDKTVVVTAGTNGQKTDLSVNVDGTTIVKDPSTGKLSVKADALEPYTGDGKAIVVDGKTISLKIDAANKILSTSANGLLASLKFVDNVESQKIELQGVDNQVVTSFDYAKFVVDGMLDDADINEQDELVLTMNTAAGSKELKVNLAKYIDVYTQGNGIEISNKTISVKLDPNTALEHSANGIKVRTNSDENTVDVVDGGLAVKVAERGYGWNINSDDYQETELIKLRKSTNGLSVAIATADLDGTDAGFVLASDIREGLTSAKTECNSYTDSAINTLKQGLYWQEN